VDAFRERACLRGGARRAAAVAEDRAAQADIVWGGNYFGIIDLCGTALKVAPKNGAGELFGPLRLGYHYKWGGTFRISWKREDVMSLVRSFLLLSIAVISSSLCTSALAHHSQTEPENILAIDNPVGPKAGDPMIAIILQDKQDKSMRKAGGDQADTKSQQKTSKPPKGPGPGPQLLNPQPEPPNKNR